MENTAASSDEDLRTLLVAALDRIAVLEARVAELDLPGAAAAAQPAAAPEQTLAAADPSGAGEPVRSMGRRQALRGAALAAGAAAAGVVLGDAAPAAAADGSNLVLGSVVQTATLPTGFAVTSGTAKYGFGITDVQRGAPGFQPCISGHAGGASGRSFDVALEGFAEGTAHALWAISDQAAAIVVNANSGRGILASSLTGTGVTATGYGSDPGVDGTSGSGYGVIGTTGTAAGIGVVGDGSGAGAVGVAGRSNTNVAVRGQSTSGIGVQAVSTSGAALQATSTSGTGVTVTAPRFHLQLANATTRSAPTSDGFAHQAGEVVFGTDGTFWACVKGGTPGTWRKVGGQATAGQFHVLPAPVRIYDSRAGTSPSQGPKTKLTGNAARTLDCTVNGSGVPAGASAVFLTLLAVNAYNGNGNLTIWPNGVARPASNTLVWGAGNGRWTTTAISGLDAAGKLQAAASASTDLVLDVVGYYR